MLLQLLLAMRPLQWTKNAIVFAALIFSQNILHPTLLAKSFAAFAVFCAVSGCVYILNDIVDIEQDKIHPKKSKRPIASGKLNPAFALFFAIILTICSLAFAYYINVLFFIIILGYFVLQLAYSLYLKHYVILDVFVISIGFVLRAVAGAEAIMVPISSWLLVCTMLLALFLGLSKRRHEKETLKENATSHRDTLLMYSIPLLDQMISVVTSSTVIAYALYTMAPETIEKFGTDNLKYTIPFVLYGILRYLYIVHRKHQGGSPEKVLLTDKMIILDVILFGSSAILILYWSKIFGG